MNVPFTVQYYNLNNCSPEPFCVYYSPAAQNPMSAVLTVLFSKLHVWCVASQQAVVRWNWLLRVLMCLFCLKIKLTLAVLWTVIGWIRSDVMATEAKLHASSENCVVFMWMQMIGFLPLLKSKLSGMMMWIW